MPIISKFETQRLSQEAFGEVAYDVMNHVFAIHNEMGRFFDEKIYQRELFNRLPSIVLEVQVDVIYESFRKQYFADMIVEDGALFEFKATDAIHPRHISQTIHYLRLTDLAHGKVVNVRPEKVESQFVNCSQRLSDLRNPEIDTSRYSAESIGSKGFRDVLISLIRDWGSGLEARLYEHALIHFLGGEEKVCQPAEVYGSKGSIGSHKMNFLAQNEVFWLTAFPQPDSRFETHTKRLLDHIVPVNTIQWANIADKKVTFVTIN